MIDPALFVLAEITVEVFKRYSVNIPEDEWRAWRTVGDVTRSVVLHAGGASNPAEVSEWVRLLFAEGYGVRLEDVVPEAGLFPEPLRLLDRFHDIPYPLGLADRLFARPKHAEPGAAPDTGRM